MVSVGLGIALAPRTATLNQHPDVRVISLGDPRRPDGCSSPTARAGSAPPPSWPCTTSSWRPRRRTHEVRRRSGPRLPAVNAPSQLLHTPPVGCGAGGDSAGVTVRARGRQAGPASGPASTAISPSSDQSCPRYGVDDPRRRGQVRRQLGCAALKWSDCTWAATGVVVAERLDEHVLGRVVEAARPVEPQAAGLGAGRLGERPADLGPAVGVLGPDPELGGDEDQRVTPRAGRDGRAPRIRPARGRGRSAQDVGLEERVGHPGPEDLVALRGQVQPVGEVAQVVPGQRRDVDDARPPRRPGPARRPPPR